VVQLKVCRPEAETDHQTANNPTAFRPSGFQAVSVPYCFQYPQFLPSFFESASSSYRVELCSSFWSPVVPIGCFLSVTPALDIGRVAASRRSRTPRSRYAMKILSPSVNGCGGRCHFFNFTVVPPSVPVAADKEPNRQAMPPCIQTAPGQAADHSRRGTHRQPAAWRYESAVTPGGGNLPRNLSAIQASRYSDQGRLVPADFLVSVRRVKWCRCIFFYMFSPVHFHFLPLQQLQQLQHYYPSA